MAKKYVVVRESFEFDDVFFSSTGKDDVDKFDTEEQAEHLLGRLINQGHKRCMELYSGRDYNINDEIQYKFFIMEVEE